MEISINTRHVREAIEETYQHPVLERGGRRTRGGTLRFAVLVPEDDLAGAVTTE
jgi:hypothetical protein